MKILKKNSTSSITELDLSYNKIRDFKFIQDLERLETLILDHNELHPQIKFPKCETLKTLWVNHNNIDNLGYFIANIAQNFPHLRYLSMMNNPAAPSYFNGGSFVQYRDYRHFVISQLPELVQLDDQPVAKEEREEAERIYSSYPSSWPLGMKNLYWCKSHCRSRQQPNHDNTNTENMNLELNQLPKVHTQCCI